MNSTTLLEVENPIERDRYANTILNELKFNLNKLGYYAVSHIVQCISYNQEPSFYRLDLNIIEIDETKEWFDTSRVKTIESFKFYDYQILYDWEYYKYVVTKLKEIILDKLEN